MSRHQLAGEIGYHNPGGPGMNRVRRWRAFAVLAVSFFMTVADLTFLLIRGDELATAVASTSQKPQPAPAKV